MCRPSIKTGPAVQQQESSVDFMLSDGVEYHDLGAHHFEQRDTEQPAKRLIQRLRDLGVAVEVTAA